MGKLREGYYRNIHPMALFPAIGGVSLPIEKRTIPMPCHCPSSTNCTTQGNIAPFEKVGIKEGEKMPMPGDADAHGCPCLVLI